jgi:hypothetical protein
VTTKLQPSEVKALVRNVCGCLNSYQQYEDFFASAGISFYPDPRESSIEDGLTQEFTNRCDHELYSMLSAMKSCLHDYQANDLGYVHKEASMMIIDGLISKYFSGTSESLIPASTLVTGDVQVACDEANRLISEGKYPEAIDRVHTFFQGYIRDKCNYWRIYIDEKAKIKDALLSVINNHEYFKELNTVPELKNFFRSLANMCDRFDAFRNNMSLAHPTGSLLASNEAKLMINIIRSLHEHLENIGENESINQSLGKEDL